MVATVGAGVEGRGEAAERIAVGHGVRGIAVHAVADAGADEVVVVHAHALQRAVEGQDADGQAGALHAQATHAVAADRAVPVDQLDAIRGGIPATVRVAGDVADQVVEHVPIHSMLMATAEPRTLVDPPVSTTLLCSITEPSPST